MDKITIAYDDNLGLPNDFAETVDCNIAAYHELGEMIKQFEKGNIFGMFIPAGALPYLKNYKIISQAIFSPENEIQLQSNFVCTKNMLITDIPQQILGRINQYCTTSFWSPLIYLMQFLPKNTPLSFRDTNGFSDMIHKTAEEIIDCAMVWDIIMQQHPEESHKVHQLFYKSDLPTPVIVISENNDASISSRINSFKSRDTNTFFNAFQAPEMNLINQFVLDMKKASEYFRVLANQPATVK